MLYFLYLFSDTDSHFVILCASVLNLQIRLDISYLFGV